MDREKLEPIPERVRQHAALPAGVRTESRWFLSKGASNIFRCQARRLRIVFHTADANGRRTGSILPQALSVRLSGGYHQSQGAALAQAPHLPCKTHAPPDNTLASCRALWAKQSDPDANLAATSSKLCRLARERYPRISRRLPFCRNEQRSHRHHQADKKLPIGVPSYIRIRETKYK